MKKIRKHFSIGIVMLIRLVIPILKIVDHYFFSSQRSVKISDKVQRCINHKNQILFILKPLHGLRGVKYSDDLRIVPEIV